ncbi:MAG: CBS domain-containing protein [Methanosarcinaceae archaeon]|nr:CBS domain-containing protein [Methanosarcinaceae archaeon]
MNFSFKIGTIMGIPIKLHVTFLLILPVFAYVFASSPNPYGFQEVMPVTTRYTLSTLTALLLFVSILLHELAHSYLAKRYGVTIDSITLFLFGGVSSMEEMPRNPSQEAKMAFAGPFVSLVIGAICLFVYGNFLSSSAELLENPAFKVIWILGVMNVVLGIFNLLPAFPMDGGRVLRSLYARKMSYVKATQSAAAVGKFFAILMAIFGILVGNLWFPLIALFIYVGATEEERSTLASVTLETVAVRDLMTKDVVSVPPSMSVEDLVHFMFENKHMGYPVIEGGLLKGIVSFTDVRRVPPLERPVLLVRDIMTKELVSVPSSAQAHEALKFISGRNIGRVLVIDDGSLVGILSRTDLVRTLRLMSE